LSMITTIFGTLIDCAGVPCPHEKQKTRDLAISGSREVFP